ncbi:anaerobic sulfatase maturase [Ferrimonas pelagia]|uniref:Anaerobic sulfatase maturase n=1 Tax=Ferrimonas pelagia TaxID=1177826 RepID=A0ABP9EMS4_9GAMM
MKKPFHLMAKPTSFECNIDCDYCFYLEKERFFKAGKARPKKQEKSFIGMSDEVLRAYVKNYIAANEMMPSIEFAWQGGEPTMAGLDFFKQALKYQQKFANGKEITNALQTNGLLLNDEWCQFLAENKILVGLSIDGPEEMHDHYRVTKSGKGTFSRVMKAIECMKKHGVEFNTLTTLNERNIHHPLEVYNFLKEIGSTFMQFIPIVEQIQVDVENPMLIVPQLESKKELTPFSANGDLFGDFMIAIFDEWVRKDVGRIFVQAFDNALAAWAGEEPPLCIHRKECGQALVIERNGDVFSCDHYVYPEYRLGNVVDDKLPKMVEQKKQEKFGQHKARVGRICAACDWRFACNGGCPKHRVHPNPDGSMQNHLCDGYKKMFAHFDPYMKYMAHELMGQRPPATVMYVADQIASRVAAQKSFCD